MPKKHDDQDSARVNTPSAEQAAPLDEQLREQIEEAIDDEIEAQTPPDPNRATRD